jgi:hypothetical protein
MFDCFSWLFSSESVLVSCSSAAVVVSSSCSSVVLCWVASLLEFSLSSSSLDGVSRKSPLSTLESSSLSEFDVPSVSSPVDLSSFSSSFVPTESSTSVLGSLLSSSESDVPVKYENLRMARLSL